MRALQVLGWLVLAAGGLLVAGTLAHRVPVLGLVSYAVGQAPLWAIAPPLLGAALVLASRPGRRTRLVALAVALATVAGAATITTRMVVAVEQAGAEVDLLASLGIGQDEDPAPGERVRYDSFRGTPLDLVIYRPTGPTDAPVLVYVHGGGWINGDADQRPSDLRWFADRGWLVVSVGYALSDEDTHLWDTVHQQIGCGLAWVGRHAARLGGDPARLSMTGESAGGNLVINVASMANTGTLGSSCGGDVPEVDAVSALYPAVEPATFRDNDDLFAEPLARRMTSAYTGGSPEEFPDRYRAISSSTYLSRRTPPTLLIHPEADHLVPVRAVREYADRAAEAGADVELVSVPYADHGFDQRPGSIGRQAYRQLTDRWLRSHGQGP